MECTNDVSCTAMFPCKSVYWCLNLLLWTIPLHICRSHVLGEMNNTAAQLKKLSSAEGYCLLLVTILWETVERVLSPAKLRRTEYLQVLNSPDSKSSLRRMTNCAPRQRNIQPALFSVRRNVPLHNCKSAVSWSAGPPEIFLSDPRTTSDFSPKHFVIGTGMLN